MILIKYKSNKTRDISFKNIMQYYYWVAIGVYFFTMLVPGFRPGVVVATFIVLLFLNSILRKRLVYLTHLDILILFYGMYNISSFAWCSVGGFGISDFIGEVAVSLVPVLLYFCTCNIKREEFYNKSLIAIILCVLIGLVLFFWMPAFYREYLSNYGFAVTSNIAHCRQGFSSFLGRIAMGTYSVFGISICIERLRKEKSKKNYLCLILLTIACILSSQRSSWVGAVAIFMFEVFHILKKRILSISKNVVMIFPVALVLVCFFIYYSADMGTQVIEKLSNFSGAFSERTFTWKETIMNLNNIVIGSGLGSVGHRVLGISNIRVTDGSYIKLLAETGIIGFLLFMAIVLIAIKKLWPYRKERYIELVMIFFILFQAIGSNVFALQVIAPILWFSIGFSNRSSMNR